MEIPRVEELLRSLMQGLPPGIASGASGLREDLENNFRAVLRANLGKLDLAKEHEITVGQRRGVEGGQIERGKLREALGPQNLGVVRGEGARLCREKQDRFGAGGGRNHEQNEQHRWQQIPRHGLLGRWGMPVDQITVRATAPLRGCWANDGRTLDRGPVTCAVEDAHDDQRLGCLTIEY